MPHRRDPMKCDERPGKGARHGGMGQGRRAKDSTPVHLGTDGNGPQGRKS